MNTKIKRYEVLHCFLIKHADGIQRVICKHQQVFSPGFGIADIWLPTEPLAQPPVTSARDAEMDVALFPVIPINSGAQVMNEMPVGIIQPDSEPIRLS